MFDDPKKNQKNDTNENEYFDEGSAGGQASETDLDDVTTIDHDVDDSTTDSE